MDRPTEEEIGSEPINYGRLQESPKVATRSFGNGQSASFAGRKFSTVSID